jgi:16S rRNA (uracil1498-N3)-methyltransferase
MSRVRVRAPLSALSPGERTLDPDAAHYLVRVLRLGAGAMFVAFDPDLSVEADAVVARVDRGEAHVRIGELRPAEVVATRPITWVQGLSKGDKCDAVVRDATELGATRIVVAQTARSVVRLDEARARARAQRWAKIAREAARQSGRADPPEIAAPRAWDAALSLVADDAVRFCLHTTAPPIGPSLRHAIASGAPLAFAAGPEGGFTDEEVLVAEAKGWHAASLGPFVLRTETVAAAVLGAVRVFTSR